MQMLQTIKSFVFQHPNRRLDYVYQAGRSELGDRPVEKGQAVGLFTDEKTRGLRS